MSDYYEGAFEEGRNLSEASANLREPSFRTELVRSVVNIIARRRSVLLVGAPGVGKTRVVHEVANLMRQSGRAKVYEFSVSQLLTGTKYLGEWESKATRIIEDAVASKAVLYFSDLWNLPTAAKSSNRDVTAWDLIRPYVEQERLQLIGEVTPDQLVHLSRAAGFGRLFEIVNVAPLAREQLLRILAVEAARLKLATDEATIDRALELCEQFLGATEGAGPGLELLEQVSDYHAQKRGVGEPEPITSAFVEKVFSIYSGLPLLVVSPSVTMPVAEMRAWFEQRVIGQHAAITAVIEAIALYKAGLHDPGRPVGSFLFVGPTGVGKTELARALARFLFGSETRLLRFDLSEYKDYHAYQLLIGDAQRPDQAARLVDPVRARPFQVVLLDEIEKAHPNVWDLLLQVLDEGRLTPATGKTVNFRNTIVIATSNVGAREQTKSAPGFVAQPPSQESMRRVLESVFRPELLNRFQHVVAFHPLAEEHVRQIARMEIERVVARQGLASRDIAVDIGASLLDLVVGEGYDAQYGARALRRAVQRNVALPIATLLLERSVAPGSILSVTAAAGRVGVEVVETPAVRQQRSEARPIKTRLGTVSSNEGVRSLLAELKGVRGALVAAAVAPREGVADSPTASDGWRDPAAWAAATRRLELARLRERRLERLQADERELEEWLAKTVTREERLRLVAALERYERELLAARRELQFLPAGSASDAILEVTELGATNAHALELFAAYRAWARERGHSVEMICEPLTPNEPIVAAVGGHYAYGYLHLETGHHRFRTGRSHDVVRVRVMPWTDGTAEVAFAARTALKTKGLLGGRVRSRLVVASGGLVIQNERTLTENGAFAQSVVPSYLGATDSTLTEVRRYEREPFVTRDLLTGATGHSDALAPERLHELLGQRIDVAYGGAHA